MAIARHGSPSFMNEPSPSPQPHHQPLTKRDVRRNRIMERLQGMISSFSANQNQHYRAQLQGVQVDMTMVLRADPYTAEGVLEDSHEDIRALVEDIMKGDVNGIGGVNLPADEASKNDYWSLAGRRYTEFVREVNAAVEERDADLTALHNGYETSLAELERLYQQRLHQAEEEHKALSQTIRARLISSLNKKRGQLLRDKEQLDIADSNAMLLHPNHFSIGNNPGSPGHNGTAVNKRTRHLRHHRGGSPGPVVEAGENGKKKRKLNPADDEQAGNESPMAALAGGRSPFKNARVQREYTQFEAPAYSLDNLFTEKELAMATDTAKVATYKYFHQPQQVQDQASNTNGTAVPSVDGEVIESAELAVDQEMADGTTAGSPPPAAPDMERTASHQVLTRGGARANPLAALSDLANAAAAASSSAPVIRENPFTPVAPPFHAVTRSEKSGAPAPPAVNSLDMENDFEMMRRAGADFSGQAEEDAESSSMVAEEAREMRKQLLDQALGISGVQAPYRLPQLETGPGALIDKRGVDREARTGFAPLLPVVAQIESRLKATNTLGLPGSSMTAALNGRLLAGAEPMSRTTSAGGVSEIGEPAGPGKRGGRGKLV
ncbi:unnamed protein product [Zymoseptoria tritici ST99CH_1A5]|uniref:Deacetylase complex subunit Sds3 n=1 Tax=Zymoseptoria tritici ST99CH_1A5 TaxID=1276529 RepID=A0A1Y6L5Z1_ZYMTR|nr:unnamed protein product [Zymoseptoria tritici ST99CH_3D1]SMY18979.1 unnamed protein product [Zymoseptoria tritici ST99CH_1A5]